MTDVRSFYRSRTGLSEKAAPSDVSAPQIKLPILQPSRTSRCIQPSSIAAAAITKEALLSPLWSTSCQSADRHVFTSVQVAIDCGGLRRHQQVLRDDTAWMPPSVTIASDRSVVCNPKKKTAFSRVDGECRTLRSTSVDVISPVEQDPSVRSWRHLPLQNSHSLASGSVRGRGVISPARSV